MGQMKNIKKFFEKNGKLALLALTITLITILLFSLGLWKKIPQYTTHVGNQDVEQFIYYMEENSVISQDFSCYRDFDFITLSFSDHEQSIEGKTVITVTDKESNEIVFYDEIENSEIHYADYVEVEWDSPKGNHLYNISIFEVQTGDVTLGIFGYPVENDENAAYVDGTKSTYAVSIGMRSHTNIYIQLFFFTVCILIVMMLLCLWGAFRARWSEEKLFLCLAVPLGIIYLSFQSINPVHDGMTHLAKVYHYSNVLIGQSEQDVRGNVYLYEEEAAYFNRETVYRENELVQQHWEMVNDFGKSLTKQYMVESKEYRETNVSSFCEYFPGAIGMTVGRLLGGSVSCNILLTRVFFFLYYVLCCYSAIKVAPKLKTVIAFTALLPMSIYQATGITYDSVVIAEVLLLFGFWMKAREDTLKKKELLFLVILAFLIGCCKGGFYALILLLFVCIPWKQFGEKRKKWIWCSALLLSAFLAIGITSRSAYMPYIKNIVQQYSQDIVTSETNLESANAVNELVENVPEKEQRAYGIMYIFKEPIQSAKIIFHSLLENADYYIGGLVGYRMAWTDCLTPWFVISSFLMLLFMAGAEDWGKLKNNFSGKERIECVLLFGAELMAFHLLMFIETAYGSQVVNGVQGRYFIAWVPVILAALRTSGIRIEKESIKKMYFGFSVVFMLYFFFFIEIIFGIA